MVTHEQTHVTNAARFLSQATEAALTGDYHKATALAGIAITHLMVAATPLPEVEPEVEPEDYPSWPGTDPGWAPTIHGRPISDFTSPIPYLDYDTVLGYLAKHLPHQLDLMDLAPDATMRDGWALKHTCAQVGRPIYKVEAPKFLKEQGIYEVNCYPRELLDRRFND